MSHSKRWKRIALSAFLTFFIALFGFNSLAQATTYGQFADVASYQPDDVLFFKNLATNQVAGVVVKLTESAGGNAYINPKAGQQIKSAQAAGLKVSLYHYAQYNGANGAKAEANFFADTAEQYGLGKGTVMVDDVEDSSLQTPYADTVTFQSQLASRGYNTQVTYSMASWFWYNKLPRNYPIWVANYGVDKPGVDNAAAWQYTSNYNGQSVDMSYDFTGLFTTQSQSTPVNNKIVTVKGSAGVPLYNGYGSSKSYARTLANNSRWIICDQVYVDGKYWYEVGRNQWIEARQTDQPYGYGNVTAPVDTRVDDATVTTIGGSTLYTGYGDSKTSTGRSLGIGTTWKICNQVYANGKFWYEVATNQWIDASTTDQPYGMGNVNQPINNTTTIAIQKSGGATLYNGYGTNASSTGRTLPTNSKWKATAQKYVNGQYWFQVATNQWINGNDTNSAAGLTIFN
ncbi:GH25 family lysozyme [Schleiferilactobacillus perolens]|uniref:GH25 family lysozyme n=1 Tax=Schleiferilactobacillus perolens TaxID=100468 RepID=UPI00235782A6|nr:GH25 family lysozyme [Schleiferilactobacillus perolens]MCI2171103.1 SLAP domain-containing protein [Schleiferilactobacillus perolens]